MSQKSYAPLVFALVVVIAAVQGCESNKSYNPHESVPPSIDRRFSVIPADAQIVATSPGDLSFLAPADGMVYLYDATDQKTVDTKRIARGQIYDVILERSMVRVGERVQPETQLLPLVQGREYRIYFSPASNPPQ